MSSLDFLEPYLKVTADAMRGMLPPLAQAPSFLGPLYYHLGWADTEFQSAEGPRGKGIRSAFCLMACELVAESVDPAVDAAAAVEFLHEFSLVHDDIEDGDRLRRHRPSLWTLIGVPQAINSGDGLFAFAQLALLRTVERGVAAERVLYAQKRLNESALALCQGQHLDMSFEGHPDVQPGEYLEMSRGKTAALLACAGELGAWLGGASKDTAAQLYRMGEAMGLAFQMRDDLLGIFGAPEQTGKPVGADVRARKKSLPVVYALSQPEGTQLRSLYEGSLDSDEDVGRAVALIQASGAQEWVASQAEALEAEARSILESLPYTEARAEPLRRLTRALGARNY